MPKLDGRNHVSLTVSDLDRSAEWYADVFGFLPLGGVQSPDFRFATLLHPQSFASIALAQPLRAPAGAADQERVGLHHLAYHVPERADLDEWVAHLDAKGIAHSGVQAPEWELGEQVWLRDPDGVQLEIYWVDRDAVVDQLRRLRRERGGLPGAARRG